jgi:hypothetical protein
MHLIYERFCPCLDIQDKWRGCRDAWEHFSRFQQRYHPCVCNAQQASLRISGTSWWTVPDCRKNDSRTPWKWLKIRQVDHMFLRVMHYLDPDKCSTRTRWCNSRFSFQSMAVQIVQCITISNISHVRLI